ncbi:MAG TPA: MFS transporter [Pyrinomonadaceae bacterium]|mgnify:CR=1 FL=1|nr:MFS transporter [Pyrinomonadaceae bacterium]
MQPEPTTNNEKFITKPLVIIFITIFIDLLGFGIVIPLLTFYAEEFNATPLDVGLLVASYSLMQFIFSPILGGLSDKYGRRPILFLSIIGSGVGYLMMGFAGALWMIYAGRILGGITGGNLSTAQAYIADVTTRENRAKGMGLFGMAFGLGFIFGPALAGILSKYGHEVPFLFAAGLSFANAILLYFILPESRKFTEAVAERKNRFSEIFDSLKDSRFTIITTEYFLLVTAFSMMTTAFAYYTMTKFGYDASQTGYLLGYVGLIAVIMQGGFFGKLAKRFGEEKLAVFGSFLLVLSFIAVPFVSKDLGISTAALIPEKYAGLSKFVADYGGLIALLIGTACFSVGNSMASPSLSSLASKNANEFEQGKVLGIMQSAASLARVVGPLICGVLLNNALNKVDDFTLTRTFWTASALMFITVLVAIYYLTQQKKAKI